MPHAHGSTLKALVKLGRSPDDCWTWLGKIDSNGCAIKQHGGVPIPARRWMWMQLFGPIPVGKIVTTSCGSKQCVNPFHLRCCTQAAACRASTNTTLLAADVAELRESPFRTASVAEAYADRFGVSAQTIRDVWRCSSWRNPVPFHGPATPKHPRRFIAAQPTGENPCSS
jgi:hypothetical protein